jgi:arginine exporter protein ArgO
MQGWGVGSETPIVKKQSERPVLITNAARSQEAQFRSRQIRYVSMMSIRAACLVLGAVLVSVHPPLLWLWLTMCVAGMVLLPWMAVLIANDRPAKTKEERAATELAKEQARQAALEQHPVKEQEYFTVDSEVVRDREKP